MVAVHKTTTTAGRTHVAKLTEQPFGRALRDLLQERDEFLTPSGSVNWREFARAHLEPRGVLYETLRKAVSSERYPSARLIEVVSDVLGVNPEYFGEYRLAQELQAFDPDEVGWEQAMENLRAWRELLEERKPTRRR